MYAVKIATMAVTSPSIRGQYQEPAPDCVKKLK